MPQTLEERVSRLEQQMQRVETQKHNADRRPWWERRFGVFANDPLYDEAEKMALELRQSQVPDYMMEEPDGDVPA